jgi:ubiquinone/menaquinone biosynthesis C-methylase UbiE
MKILSEKQKKQEEEYIFPYHYLDLVVDSYKLVWHVEYLSFLNMIKNFLRPFNDQLILDAGCGDGRFCFQMSKENVRMVGVDYSKRAIAFARIFNPKSDFYTCDLKKLNIKSKFDSIVLIETLEHIKPAEIQSVLHDLSRVLKKNGKLIITVPSKNLPLQKKHYQHFSTGTLRAALKDYFKVKKIVGHGKNNYQRKFYNVLKRFGILIIPFNKRLPFCNNYYLFMKNYYEKNLKIGKPEECKGLIAICEKIS